MNIQEQLKRIKEEAQKLGVDLKIYPKNFDPQRLDTLWYEGDIASFKYNNYTVIISAAGDVDASYFEDGKLLYNFHKEPCLIPELTKHLTDEELHDGSTTQYTYIDEKKLFNKIKYYLSKLIIGWNLIFSIIKQSVIGI